MRFKGKTAPWWYAATLLVNSGLAWLIYRYHFNPFAFLYIVPVIAIDLYLIPVIFCNYADISDKILLIRFGVSKEEILIEDILSLQQMNRFGISYCASTDCIFLTCRRGVKIVISLQDNKAFIKELQRKNKKIKVFL